MDFDEFLSTVGVAGSRKIRIITGALGAVIGGGLGVFAGPILSESAMAAYSHGFIGALVGGGLGALFSGLIVFGLLVVVGVAAVVGWQIYTGG